MTLPCPRFTVRRLMVVVVILATVKYLNALSYSTHHGWNTSILPRGERVVTSQPIQVGEMSLPRGTPCEVVRDDGDIDSAYAYRFTEVKVSGGRLQGAVLRVLRTNLRGQWPFQL